MSRNNMGMFMLLFYDERILSRFSEERGTRYVCITSVFSDTLIGRADNMVRIFIAEQVAQNMRFTAMFLETFTRTTTDVAAISTGEQFIRHTEITNGFLANLVPRLSTRVHGASTEEQIARNLRISSVFICITLRYIVTTTTIIHEEYLRRNAALMAVFPGIIPLAINRNETVFTEEELGRHLEFISVFTGIQVENTVILATINARIQDINQRHSNTFQVTSFVTVFTEEHLDGLRGAISVFSAGVVERN